MSEKKLDIPKGHYPVTPLPPYMCGCGVREPQKKTDCFYYWEEPDMGAHIPSCSLRGLGDCPCVNCKDYLSSHEAAKVVAEYVRNRR